jgi:hypothetical protein
MLDIGKVLPDLSSFTSATLSQEYEHIGRWEVGQQMVATSLEGQPYIHSRTYSIPQPIEAPTHISKVSLPYDLDGGRNFYRTEVEFTVVECSSQVAPSLSGYSKNHTEEDFKKWNRRELRYIHEEYHHDRISSTPSFRRELPPLDEEKDKNEFPLDASLRIYPLLTLTFSVGRALAFSYEPYGVGMASAKMGGKRIPRGEKIDIDRDTIEFQFTSYGVSLALYGEEIAQMMNHPLSLLSEEESVIHGAGTPIERRLLPPGGAYSELPSDYWNDPKREKISIGNYTSRGPAGWGSP